MSKKIITACMALFALAAFALPASASAANNPHLTSGGVTVPVGTSITATGVGTQFTTTAGAKEVECSHAHMTGTVTKEAPGVVEGEIPLKSAIFQGTGAVAAHNNLPECTGNFGNAWITVVTALCVRSDSTMVNDEFQVTGGACGTNGKSKFIIGSTTAGECEYETTGAVKGTFTTNATPANLTTINTSTGSGSTRIRGGFLCPESGALKMTFNLSTTNGTPITIS